MKQILFAVLTCSLVLMSSCKVDIDGDKFKNVDPLILSAEEVVSIFHDSSSEIPTEVVETNILDFLSVVSDGKKTRSSSDLILHKRYDSGTTDFQKTYGFNLSGEEIVEESVAIYEYSDGDGGLIIASADSRYPKVLAYLPDFDHFDGEYPDEFKANMAQLYAGVITEVNYIEAIKAEKRESTIKKISDHYGMAPENVTYESVKGLVSLEDSPLTRGLPVPIPPEDGLIERINPICNIAWDQFAPYNGYLPIALLSPKLTQSGEPERGITPSGIPTVIFSELMATLRPRLTIEGVTMRWGDLTATEFLTETGYPPHRPPDSPATIHMVRTLYKHVYEGLNNQLVIDENGHTMGPECWSDDMRDFMLKYFDFTELITIDFDRMRQTLRDYRAPVHILSDCEYYESGRLTRRAYRSYMADGVIHRSTNTAIGVETYFHYEFGFGGWANGWYIADYTSSYKPYVEIYIPNTDTHWMIIKAGLGTMRLYADIRVKPEYR